MQAIHSCGEESYVDWGTLWAEAGELGEWIIACRSALKAGNPASLRDAPPFVSVSSQTKFSEPDKFRGTAASEAIHAFLNDARGSAAILAFRGNMVKSVAQAGSWRAPMNEGAQLDELDTLIQAIEAHEGNAEALALAFVAFAGAIGAGLTEVVCSALRAPLGTTIDTRRAGQTQTPWLDCLEAIYASPDHRGIAAAMRAVRDVPPPGYNVRLKDHAWALCAFDRTDDPRALRSTLGRIRRRWKWPPQMVSTIHKAKGLDFDHVLLCPVDRHQYPGDVLGARLLYIALSRPRRSIRLILAADAPSRHLSVRN